MMSGRHILVVAVATLVGLAAGLGAYTFVYANGASYMTDDPTACANCHVMSEQLSGWTSSSHRSVAVCNDCHTPPGAVAKYTTKALNGFNHSLAFTTGRFHEPIRINQRNRAVTAAACRKCHDDITATIDPHAGDERGSLDCITCHRDVGHRH